MFNTINLAKCTKCGRDTLLPVCVKCLRGDPPKSEGLLSANKKKSTNNIKSIMDIHKLKVIKYSKNPSFIDLGSNKPKNKRYTWATTKEIIDDKFLAKNNWGIICNKKSGVMGVDLDTHKWQEDNLFYKTFGKDFIKKFNTYTQKTPNGGYHLVFLYDKDLNQTESKLNSKFGKGIDIRNGHEDKINAGGYLLGAGSIFKKKDGTFGKYKIINDVKPTIINEDLKKWLLDNIYNTIEKTNKKKKDFKNKFNIETELLHSVYNYYITEEEFQKYILNDIEETYLEDYSNWFILTACMKTLGFKKLWNRFSKGSSAYNKEKNYNIWASISITSGSYYVETIFKNCYDGNDNLEKRDCSGPIEIIKYKPTIKDIVEPTKTINRPKLTQLKDAEKEKLLKDDPLNLQLKKYKNNYVIKSDTGTGKTTLMKDELFNSGQKFISIVSRISLGKEQYQNFNEYGINCLFYANCWPEKGDSIITTIDSLLGCGRLMDDIGSYTIFIDEFNSVLEYIMQADTCLNKVRSKIWKYLIYILTNCKNFVCVDADISDMSLNFLKDLELKYTYINNEYKHNKGVNAHEFFDLVKFIKEIKKHDKYIVCCDSKKSAEFIYLETHEKAKLLTSGTDKLTNETLDDYDKVIFSPSIIYGLDSSMRRPVFVYHKESTISPKNMIQQVARCRDITNLYYCFQKQKFNQCKFLEKSDARDHIKLLSEMTDQEFDVLDKEESKRQELFGKLYAEYIYKQDIYDTNKYIHFKLLLEKRGFIMGKQITNKTVGENKKYIKDVIDEYKVENFDIESDRIQEFNEKYLGLTKTQLKSIEPLFLKDEYEMNTMFLLKKYFTMGYKNEPLFNMNVSSEDLNVDITPSILANTYDYETVYDTLSEQDEIKIKKISTNKFKFYLIDKLKVLCDYKGTKKGHMSNIIKANKIPNQDEITKWIKLYKVAFNYRGKKEPVIKSTNDAEKYLYDMFKKTFGKDLYGKKKVRTDPKTTKMLYYLDQKSNLLDYAKQIAQYQKINKFNLELNDEIFNRNYDNINFNDDDDF